MSLLRKISDVALGKAPFDCNRSPQWQKVRNVFLKQYPECAVCGSKSNLEVHHIVPFHVNHLKELSPANLITLCENSSKGVTCHLLFGHLGDYKKDNPNVEEDAQVWREKLK
jgi:5-methylcytosine-specific restriction endonuclease McrA